MKKIIIFMLFLIPTFVTAVSIDCYNCSDCTAKLNQPYDVVKLDADVVNYAATCINNPPGFNNKIFDCQGHTIDGVRTVNTYGIYLNGKTNNTIKNCRITNFYQGIYLLSSINNSMDNNTANWNSRHGIYLRNSKYNSFTHNTVNSNTNHGIYLYLSSDNNIITNNTANSNSGSGINLYSSRYNNLINNTANNNNEGIYLYNYNNRYNNIINNKALFNKYGIYLGYDSRYSTVTGNTANNNTQMGIYLYNAASNKIINNTAISNTYDGIQLRSSSNNNKIINNTADFNGRYGLYFYSSKSNTITQNIIESNTNYAIYIEQSLKNTFKNNIVNNHTKNFHIISNDIPHYHHDIDSSNTFDGIPIYYWTNIQNAEIPDNANFVALISCDNITVKNLILQNNPYGVLVVNTTNSRILNNTLDSNYQYGIYLYSSSDNIIANNTANSNSKSGIYLFSSPNNILERNTANSNNQRAIHLLSSFYNSINDNTANSNNQYGIYLQNSQYNIITRNTAYNNTYHGIYLDYQGGASSNNKIINNTANSNKENGIYVTDSQNNDVINNTANNNRLTGIYLWSADNNEIINNIANSNTQYHGIYLYDSVNNDIIDNIANSNGDAGIYINWMSNGNTAINNSADSNGVGIAVQRYSGNNKVILNSVSFNNYGLRVDWDSDSNEVTGNEMISNTYGIELSGAENNEINNNLVYSNEYGIYLQYHYTFGSSNNNNIMNNTVNLNSIYGIYLSSASNNNITNNTINSNIGFETGTGLHLVGSHSNRIISNSIESNNIHGISLKDSSNNRLQENTILNNPVGISSENSNSTINWNFVCYNTMFDFNSSLWLSSGDDNTCNEPDGWDDSGTTGCTYPCPGCLLDEDCLDNQFCNVTENKCDDLDCLESFNHTCIDLNETDAPITVSNLSEIFRQNYSFVENITVSNALINSTASGNVSGIVNMDYEIITLDTGPFAGKGFSKATWVAVLDNITYSGELNVFSFLDSDGKIYVQGDISGEITGIFEGSISETINGSGVYDNLYGIWRFNRLKNQIVSGELNLNGTINYQNSTNSTVGIYALQTSIEGTTQGHYPGPIEVTISHVRMINGSYSGEGFSIISYITGLGSGQGYTYDILQDKIEMNGMFTDPLLGIVSGTLDESTGQLLLRIERIDIGLEPMADLQVDVWGPNSMSPGEIVTYIIEYRNDGLISADDTVIVAQLPDYADYVSSDGIYHFAKHQAFWKLGTVAPQEKGHLTVKVWYHWGLESGSIHGIFALTGTSSPSRYPILSDIQEYITYNPKKVVSAEVIPTKDVASALALELHDQKVSDLYDYANELGYNYTKTIVTLDLNGSKLTRIIMQNNSNHLIGITKYENISFLELHLNNTIMYFDRDGGMSFNPMNSTSAWGTWNISHSPSLADCIFNGITSKLPEWAISEAANFLSGGTAVLAKAVIMSETGCRECIEYFYYTSEVGLSCASCLSNGIESLPVAGEIVDIVNVVVECDEDPNKYACVPGEKKDAMCGRDVTWGGSTVYAYSWAKTIHKDDVVQLVCDENALWTTEKLENIKECTMKIYGKCEGKQCKINARDPEMNDECICVNGKCRCVCKRNGRIRAGDDPNIKYGLDGYVLAGQKLDYEVEFENIGEGIAFGVYFTDTLDGDLNDSTLEIGEVIAISNDTFRNNTIIGNGTYNPQTRTITWRIWGGIHSAIGPGEGGYANLNISVNANATRGTFVINYAKIEFPSVPQTTPTNSLVAVVAEYGIEGNGTCNCSNCFDCTAALTDNKNCYNVKLTADLNQSGPCIDNPKNFNNKTFDCQEHIIDGDGHDFGIYLNEKTDNLIRNCVVNDFSIGIYLKNSSGNNIVNNSFCSNNYYDISASSLNFGDNNTCDTANWNDSGTIGCSYTCPTVFNLSLIEGWNLISIPVEINDWILPAPFSSIIGNYSNVFGFINGNWVELMDNDEINETMGLWINMLQNGTLVVIGSLSKSPINFNLNQGYNLIGYPTLNESNVSYVFGNVSDLINIFSYENDVWYSYFPLKNKQLNTLKKIKPGYGYWVKVKNDTTWIFNGGFK